MQEEAPFMELATSLTGSFFQDICPSFVMKCIVEKNLFIESFFGKYFLWCTDKSFNKKVSPRELGVADRLLWLLVVLAALSTAAVLTQNFWAQWKDEQVFVSDNIIICRHLIRHEICQKFYMTRFSGRQFNTLKRVNCGYFQSQYNITV